MGTLEGTWPAAAWPAGVAKSSLGAGARRGRGVCASQPVPPWPLGALHPLGNSGISPARETGLGTHHGFRAYLALSLEEHQPGPPPFQRA